MSTDDGTLPECPKCHARDSIDLSDGTRLCLQCQNEWRPGDVPAPAAVPINRTVTPGDVARSILEDATIEDVLASQVVLADNEEPAPDTIETLYNAPPVTDDDWTDAFVRLSDGRTALVLEDAGGNLRVQFSDLTETTVFARDVTYLGDEPVDPQGVVLPEDAGEPLPQTILAVAGLCLTVALECVPADNEHPGEIASPRIGWLPPPCDQVPEAECGVAYAAALLISVFGLDREQVQRLAANLITGAESGVEMEHTQ